MAKIPETTTPAAAKVTKTRIYKVNNPDGSVALVDAPSAKGAVNHIVGKFFKAELATQHELVDAVQQGIQIEKAGEVAEDQADLPGTGSDDPQG